MGQQKSGLGLEILPCIVKVDKDGSINVDKLRHECKGQIIVGNCDLIEGPNVTCFHFQHKAYFMIVSVTIVQYIRLGAHTSNPCCRIVLDGVKEFLERGMEDWSKDNSLLGNE